MLLIICKRLLYLITAGSTIFAVEFSIAQVPAVSFGRVVLNIELDDGILQENSCLEITLFDAISSGYANQKTTKRYEVKNLHTRVELQLTKPRLYARILFLAGGELKPKHDSPVALIVSNSIFILEEGDSVTFHLQHRKANTPKTVSFSGNSAAKYQTMFDLNNVLPYPDTQHAAIDAAMSDGKYERALTLAKTFSTTQYKTCESMIKKEKSLSSQVRDLLLVDCRARFAKAYTAKLGGFSESKQRRLVFEKIKNALDKSYRDLSYANSKNPMIIESFYFGDYLLQRELLLQELQFSDINDQYNKGKRSYPFGAIYQSITGKFEGEIQEKVLLLAFIRLMNFQGDAAEYWDKAEPLFDHEPFKKLFSDLKKVNFLTFEFGLEDEKGRIWQTDDFKGKVVLVDFWFTGCAPCMAVAKVLKPIKNDLFNSRDDIVFVNICVDEQKERWSTSLKGGKYTADFEINLWTNGEGKRHSMIRDYGIYSFPTLFLISRDGTLLTRALPRPDGVTPQTSARFKETILKFMAE